MKNNKKICDALWSDCETDKERASFLISGHGYRSGIIAKEIQDEVAMAFAFRSKIMEEQ